MIAQAVAPASTAPRARSPIHAARPARGVIDAVASAPAAAHGGGGEDGIGVDHAGSDQVGGHVTRRHEGVEHGAIAGGHLPAPGDTTHDRVEHRDDGGPVEPRRVDELLAGVPQGHADQGAERRRRRRPSTVPTRRNSAPMVPAAVGRIVTDGGEADHQALAEVAVAGQRRRGR